jgi:hypothetical protein
MMEVPALQLLSKHGALSEPANVEKARLARRAGRHTRFQQVVALVLQL